MLDLLVMEVFISWFFIVEDFGCFRVYKFILRGGCFKRFKGIIIVKMIKVFFLQLFDYYLIVLFNRWEVFVLQYIRLMIWYIVFFYNMVVLNYVLDVSNDCVN